MKKIILTFMYLGFLATHTYALAEMEPLSAVAQRVFTNNPKDLEVAYFTGRCAAAYLFTSNFFKEISPNESQLIEDSRRLGGMYARVSSYLHTKYGSTEFLAEQQMKGFLKEYSQGFSIEKKTYNKFIVNDMKVCDTYSSQFSKLADVVGK